MGRFLFIGAHPDDETFFAAGTFARCIAEGHQVSLVCATLGQRGKTGGVCEASDLAYVRERELRNAMSILGVNDITLLNYQDRELSAAPLEEMRAHLVRAIRRIRPDLIMTFDPNGGNAHPDHIAISAFASDALAVAADGRWMPELGLPHQIRRLLWTPPVFVYKVPPERDLSTIPGYDFIVNVTQYVSQKEGAFRAHATQFPGLRRLFFDDPNGARTFHLEGFRLAWGERPAVTPASDLWSDL